jgi:hypothetical protein
MALFNKKALENYLKTGEYTLPATEDVRHDEDKTSVKIEQYLALDAAADIGAAGLNPPTNPDFESKHPRGNSGNKGQFRKSEKTLAKLDEADDLSGTKGATPSSSGSSELETAKNVLAKLRAERGDDNKYVHEWETKDIQGETAYTVFAGVEGERVRSKDLEEALQEAGIKTARVHLIPGNKLLVTGISAS